MTMMTNRSASHRGSKLPNFVPARLTLVREKAAMSKEDLARRCDVSRRTVTNWESGRVAYPPLDVLARLFDVGKEFFSQPLTHDLTEADVSFRALSTLGAHKARRVLATARLALELDDWAGENFELPAADIPSVDDLASPHNATDVPPAQVAKLLRAAWKLGEQPVKNIMRVVERRGVRIYSLPAPDRDVDAFSFWMAGRPFVFVNTTKSAERLRYDIAHELGHLCMHKGVSTAREKLYEYDANQFASSFLMPDKGVIAQAKTASRNLRLNDVMVMKQSWRVSAVAMVRRLHDLKLIADWHYRTWMIDLSAQGYRKSEPNGIAHEQSGLWKEMLGAARISGWSLQHIARMSGVPYQDVKDVYLGLTVLPLDGSPVRPVQLLHQEVPSSFAPNFVHLRRIK